MSIPTKGDEFAKLIEHIRKAEEHAAMLSHLYADESRMKQKSWLQVSELMKRMAVTVTDIATKGLN